MFDSDHLMNAYDTESPANAHKLACVFFIMAIGVMFDLNRQPCECDYSLSQRLLLGDRYSITRLDKLSVLKSFVCLRADNESISEGRSSSSSAEHVSRRWDSSTPVRLRYRLCICAGHT